MSREIYAKSPGMPYYLCFMRAEIITIGTEILLGQTLDTNSAWLGQRLTERGVEVCRVTSVSDKPEDIVAALDAANSAWVFVTGGLGPTKDDLTKHVLTDYFHDTLTYRPEVYAHIEALFATMGRVPNSLNRPQAELPSKATILHNAVGTAQGMMWEESGRRVVSMPGVPYEMKRIMEDGVLPLMDKMQSDAHVHRYFVVQGVPESELALQIQTWEDALPKHVSLAYLPSAGFVKLRLTAIVPKSSIDAAHFTMQELSKGLRSILGNSVYTEDLSPLEVVVGHLLVELGQTLATAESCTGGAVAARVTSVPGSSAYFRGAVVAYANDVKQHQLGVGQADLLLHGAVSEAVVRQMAQGARKRLRSDWAIATSGVAGPDGGTKEKPIGTVWIAIAGPKTLWSKCFQMGKNRERTVEKTVQTALNALRSVILEGQAG